MPKNPSKLRRRGSVTGPCICDDSDHETSSDEELIPRESRCESSNHPSDPFLGLLVVASLVFILNSPSIAIWLGSNVLFLRFTSSSENHELLNRDAASDVHYGKASSLNSNTNETVSSCSNLPPVKLIAIRGERHSATNLFRDATNRNGRFQQSCQRSNSNVKICGEILGWKHGFLESGRDVVSEDIVVAVLVRDVFSWLVSMFNEPYNMVMNEGTDEFGKFLQAKYVANECESPDYYNGCTYPFEAADNLIQLRMNKYRNWIDFLSNPTTSNSTESRHIHRWSIVKQEDLAYPEQEQTILSFFKQHCISTLMPKFKPVHKIVTNSMQSNHAKKEEILRKFTVEELHFVLFNLDRDFESRALGYNYRYVEEHIEQRSNGQLEYSGPPLLKGEVLEKRLKLIEDNLKGELPGRDISYDEAKKKSYEEKQKKAISLHLFKKGKGKNK